MTFTYVFKVQVYRVDDVQGEEFRALIVSTVRTCTKEPPAEEDAGFLMDAKVLLLMLYCRCCPL